MDECSLPGRLLEGGRGDCRRGWARFERRAVVGDDWILLDYGRARTIPLLASPLPPCGLRSDVELVPYHRRRLARVWGSRREPAGPAGVRARRRVVGYRAGGLLDLSTLRLLWPRRGRRRPWGALGAYCKSYYSRIILYQGGKGVNPFPLPGMDPGRRCSRPARESQRDLRDT